MSGPGPLSIESALTAAVRYHDHCHCMLSCENLTAIAVNGVCIIACHKQNCQCSVFLFGGSVCDIPSHKSSIAARILEGTVTDYRLEAAKGSDL